MLFPKYLNTTYFEAMPIFLKISKLQISDVVVSQLVSLALSQCVKVDKLIFRIRNRFTSNVLAWWENYNEVGNRNVGK